MFKSQDFDPSYEKLGHLIDQPGMITSTYSQVSG